MITDSQSESSGRKKPTRQKKKQLTAAPGSAGSSLPVVNAPLEGLAAEPIGQTPATVNYRRLPKGLRSAFGEKSAFLSWGLPTEIADSPAAKVLNKLQKAIQRDAAAPALAARVAEELAVADAAGQGSGRLFLSLAAAYALPQLSDAQEGKPFAEITAAIHSLVHQPDLDVEADPVNWLLSAVELPLVLGFTADPIDSHRLAELSSRYSLFVEQNLEEEGWVPQPVLGELAVLHAALLRCQLLLRQLNQRLDERVAHRLEWMTRNLFRLLDHSGRQMLGGGIVEDQPGLARAARRVTTDEDDSRMLKAIETGNFPPPKRLPECSGYCEETLTAVLRGNWGSKTAKLAIRVSEGRQLVEGGCRETLLQGNWTPEITFNGETLSLRPETTTLNCWNSDHESDYLEIQVELSGGVIWQRQYALDKRELVLFVSDVFLGKESGRWEYRCHLPVSPELAVEEAADSRELRLQGSNSTALALPLSMGEWKADRSDDAFVAHEQGLEARQTRRGQGCLFAVAIDLDPKRSQRPATWRHLTVGENLKPVARDQALAFRFQFGRQQWLIYRSLTPLASRTYLGQNVYSEFAFDRFANDGTAESLVCVE
ncbi:MAG: hypothetical protein ACK56D_15400 [Planctomycetota bacterium]